MPPLSESVSLCSSIPPLARVRAWSLGIAAFMVTMALCNVFDGLGLLVCPGAFAAAGYEAQCFFKFSKITD